jgi:glycyl-tRNA synthetase
MNKGYLDNSGIMEKVVSLAKRRGFVFPGSEIYGGLSGTWDYGHYGVLLKERLKELWRGQFVGNREEMYCMDAAILMRQEVWQASGHVDGFHDPLAECARCHHRFRVDQLITDQPASGAKCPDCGGQLGNARQFNMMFRTHIGAAEDESALSYLRPETAQGMFTNFKNAVDAWHPKLPFGLAQIGKAFRNEIAPRDFLFRTREFEQMEIEYFVRPREWEKYFDEFRRETLKFFAIIGLAKKDLREVEVPIGERAHYSKRTIDFEFAYPFGWKELSGLAYRTDFDLLAHQQKSGVSLAYLDEVSQEKIIPHVIEPSFGLDRLVLAVLTAGYSEDEMNGERRVFLRFSPKIAPVKAAVFPLLRNKSALVSKARQVFQDLRVKIGAVEFDDNGNIGKRYRRADEIGTPFCVTIDFDSLEQDDVTVRYRDTGKQERVAIKDLVTFLQSQI